VPVLLGVLGIATSLLTTLLQLGLSVGVLVGPVVTQPLVAEIGVSRTFGVLGASFLSLALISGPTVCR
jgi:hypothetical protein